MAIHNKDINRAGKYVSRTLSWFIAIMAVLIAVLVIWLAVQANSSTRAKGEASPHHMPASGTMPVGYGPRGVSAGTYSPNAREVAVMVDPSCPFCQEFMKSDIDELRKVADNPSMNLYLIPVNIFPASEVNPIALELLHAGIANGNMDPLMAYGMISEAARVAAGNKDKFRTEIETTPLAKYWPTECCSASLVEWTKHHTQQNRSGIGKVPSGVIDGVQVDIDTLRREGLGTD
ncbi:hypothetical protein [Paeniglutamicibacter sp. Y32M11]|uniref:DsbA family protein n=1 Tax=Paeniglutamicibacter sp. Y32M11 TaxID=2853258 RepID=UPI001C52C9C8|nr:hypothetical protein [Paeniglutamicibacter sp. Y32M11]QXQ10729.1 hypothetical protein KUF55_01915 [Paeniglutamicibacter sp. Y32M11]